MLGKGTKTSFQFNITYFNEIFTALLFFLFQITAKAAVIFVTLQYNVTIPATGMCLAGVYSRDSVLVSVLCFLN